MDSEVLYRDVMDNQFTSPHHYNWAHDCQKKAIANLDHSFADAPLRSRDSSIHLKFFSIQSKILMGII